MALERALYTLSLSLLPAATAPRILKLQTEFYKSKSYFGFFKVFACLNLASSCILFQWYKPKLTPANSLSMQRESSKNSKKKIKLDSKGREGKLNKKSKREWRTGSDSDSCVLASWILVLLDFVSVVYRITHVLFECVYVLYAYHSMIVV